METRNTWTHGNKEHLDTWKQGTLGHIEMLGHIGTLGHIQMFRHIEKL